MKLNELKKIIRTTIKSEVRKAIREELTEIMLGKEEKKPSLSKMVKPKKKVNNGGLKFDAISIPLIQDTNSKACTPGFVSSR